MHAGVYFIRPREVRDSDQTLLLSPDFFVVLFFFGVLFCFVLLFFSSSAEPND